MIGSTKHSGLLSMKLLTSTVSLLLLFAVRPATGQDKQGPDLPTTIEFMNRMVEPEQRIITMANRCEFEIVNNMALTFFIPDGTRETKDQSGVPHSEFTFAEIEDGYQVERFRLDDLDPSSIKSHGGFSSEFIREHHPVQPSDLESPDSFVVNFSTRDLKKSIEVGGLKGSGTGNGTKVFSKAGSNSGWLFVFLSKDRAERFVTAFVYAVKLCGGKAADFPPTPTEKR
jgi:hypothetical protein